MYSKVTILGGNALTLLIAPFMYPFHSGCSSLLLLMSIVGMIAYFGTNQLRKNIYIVLAAISAAVMTYLSINHFFILVPAICGLVLLFHTWGFSEFLRKDKI